MNKTIIAIVLVVLLVGGYFAFRGGHTMDTMETATPDTAYGTDADGVDMGVSSVTGTDVTPVPAPAPVSDSTSKTFTVTGSNFAFAPNTLSVNKGDKVTIIFKNSGGLHDWKIDEF